MIFVGNPGEEIAGEIPRSVRAQYQLHDEKRAGGRGAWQGVLLCEEGGFREGTLCRLTFKEITKNVFVEYCKVHDNYYGTHKGKLNDIVSRGKVPLFLNKYRSPSSKSTSRADKRSTLADSKATLCSLTCHPCKF